MSDKKNKIILFLKKNDFSLHNYILSNQGMDINDLVKKYLILNNLRITKEDFDFILKLFEKNEKIALSICKQMVLMQAKYDFRSVWSRLVRLRSTLELQAAIGILLTREFSPEGGNIETTYELVNNQYRRIKNRIKSFQTLGSLCIKILPEEELFTVIDGGAANTDMPEVFNNIPPSHLNLFMFEPVPELAETERERFSRSPVKAKVFELGLWHEKSTAKLSMIGNPSVFPRNENANSQESYIQINLDSLNNIFHYQNKSFIDFVKLNIEGSELSALHGMTHFLDEIVLLRTEVKFNHNNRSHPKYFEIANFLEKRGFELIDMARPKYGFLPDFGEVYPRTVSITDSWLAPVPLEAHWIFMNQRASTPAKALKKIIALEAYGKIPQAIYLFKSLIENKSIKSHLEGIGLLSEAIQCISENYLNQLKKHT